MAYVAMYVIRERSKDEYWQSYSKMDIDEVMDFERKIIGTNISKIYREMDIEGVWKVMSSFLWNSEYSYRIPTFNLWDHYLNGPFEIVHF